MLLELELPRLLAPNLPSNGSSLRDLDYTHSNYTRMLLDITREEVEIRTHGIIHLEHHVETQDTELK
jgi:hypothetical protein